MGEWIVRGGGKGRENKNGVENGWAEVWKEEERDRDRMEKVGRVRGENGWAGRWDRMG